jgi:hypothetical protein
MGDQAFNSVMNHSFGLDWLQPLAFLGIHILLLEYYKLCPIGVTDHGQAIFTIADTSFWKAPKDRI